MGGETCIPIRAKRLRELQAEKISNRKYWPSNTGLCFTEMDIVLTFNHLYREGLRRTHCYGKYRKREWFELLTNKISLS